MCQNKYLNNIVEQDHRAVKRITRPTLGFKSFWSARILVAGIETMHMIRKGQMDCPANQPIRQRSSSTASLPDHQLRSTLFSVGIRYCTKTGAAASRHTT